jgi:hypothetical protein
LHGTGIEINRCPKGKNLQLQKHQAKVTENKCSHFGLTKYVKPSS